MSSENIYEKYGLLVDRLEDFQSQYAALIAELREVTEGRKTFVFNEDSTLTFSDVETKDEVAEKRDKKDKKEKREKKTKDK